MKKNKLLQQHLKKRRADSGFSEFTVPLQVQFRGTGYRSEMPCVF